MHYHFGDTLTSIDAKKHLPFPFDVPEGATQIDVRYSFAPRGKAGVPGNNNLGLSLFDPQGARGAGHSRPNNDLTLSAVYATPGYVAGPLQPGQWTLFIDSHMILAEVPVTFTMDIDVTSEPVSGSAPQFAKGHTAPRGPGWYRGDLHGHTFHSDGHWDVADFVQYARDYKLDFVTLSDHNTVSGLAEIDSFSSDDLLTMGGEELTTYYGHCLALGTRQWQEWRIKPGLTMPNIAQGVMDSGATFIIAHPMSDGDPICTGCDWQYDDMMPGNARVVEIWNSPWDSGSNNEKAVQLWYSWLNAGYRMAATTGTDIHGPARPEEKLGFNVVYADELSEAGILAAIRKGHLYISRGPQIKFTGQSASGAQAIPGDVLPSGESAEIRVKWDHCPADSSLRFVADGRVIETRDSNGQGEASWQLSDGQYRWCVVEIREADGDLLAVTNPIFTGWDKN